MVDGIRDFKRVSIGIVFVAEPEREFRFLGVLLLLHACSVDRPQRGGAVITILRNEAKILNIILMHQVF